MALNELSSRSKSDESVRGKSLLVLQQPLLFKTQGNLYIKVDRLAVNVGKVEFQLMVFNVFNVSFPHDLKQF